MAKHPCDMADVAAEVMMSAYTLRALHAAVVNQASGTPIGDGDLLMLVRGLVERAGIYLENAHTWTGEGTLGAFGPDDTPVVRAEVQQ